MSFRLADLKKSVRKGKEGYQVTPTLLEGRAPAFRIEFLLQQFEGHLGCPRRMLDPDSLIEFVGDSRLGRGLVATLSQWYRMRARTFAEVLPDGGVQLLERAIAGPVDLRGWLYSAANRGGKGYLEPEGEALFWQGQTRALGLRREELRRLMHLDSPEEAVLVRTGPRPSAADVMAAYNGRAHTTLLRTAAEVALQCRAPSAVLERAARTWAGSLGVEWRVEGDTLRLSGRADALGCWTRHGRRVERAVLELLALPELGVRELTGRLEIRGRDCRFRWKADALALLGAGTGAPLDEALPEQISALAITLRRERDRGDDPNWGIRRPAHFLGVERGVCLPHLELRRGDLRLYLRLVGSAPEARAIETLAPFHGKTPVALVAGSGGEADRITLQFPGEESEVCRPDALLAALAARLDRQPAAAGSTAADPRGVAKRAA